MDLKVTKIKVVKRDKVVEGYDPEKIKKIVIASGLSTDQAKKLVSVVNKWLKKSEKAQVTSLQIRDRVLIEIQKINEDAARKFIWFEKYKDKNFGVNF